MQLTSVILWFSRLKKYFVLSFYLKQELLIKGNPKNLRLGTKRNNKTIVLSDMLSGSIKYKDLWSEIHTLIAIFLIRNSYLLIKIGNKRIKILILNSGWLQICRHISFVGSYRLHRTKRSNKTIVLSDMLSDSIKYQDLWSEIHTLIAIFLIRNSFLK